LDICSYSLETLSKSSAERIHVPDWDPVGDVAPASLSSDEKDSDDDTLPGPSSALTRWRLSQRKGKGKAPAPPSPLESTEVD
jgi:hypothetical protein